MRRRIEIALKNAEVGNASEVATTAADAIQPLIESLKAHREAADAGAKYAMTISNLVRTSPPSELRTAILAALQTSEPWNGEWVRLARGGA